jgi:hypothetical protein
MTYRQERVSDTTYIQDPGVGVFEPFDEEEQNAKL